MSASRRQDRRFSDNPEWRKHAFCTDPADRAAAEDAITGLYALLGEPPPEFVWVASPSAAVSHLPSPQAFSMTRPLPLEGRLATRVAALRGRGSPPTESVSALRQTVKESVAALVRAAIPHHFGLHWYGQQDAYWVALCQPGPEAELWATLVRSCGWWWPRDGVCVISERPLAIRTEPLAGSAFGEARLHSATGPAVVYPDGWAVHVWHGTRVPSWVIDDPAADRINQELNVEVRRCAIEHLGWPAYIEQAGLRLLSRAPDPGNPGCELRLYNLPRQKWQAPTRLLLAVNGSVERDGTRRRYGLRVPAGFDHPLDAAGWSYGLSGVQYAQLLRRT